MERADQLNLEHHLITHYLKISALALGRPNILIVLKGIQWSRISTRSDCEKLILDAWGVNSGLADCLKLLRKFIAFRMRKKGLHAALMEYFEQECVELELNKKLAAFLSGS